MSKLEVPFHIRCHFFAEDILSVETGEEGLGPCSFLWKDRVVIFLGKDFDTIYSFQLISPSLHKNQ